jgi:hypothetical protein
MSSRRFRATIRKQGANPYVDVPEAVSRAFAPLARAGRIAFEGTLNGASVRGMLVPVGGGGHRLYVNGGMRAASGVGVGGTASFVLRATSPDAVQPPEDVAAALRRRAGARAAFEALSPSHRRELLRYVDDARTPDGRRRRIEKAIDHTLGRRVWSGARRPQRPLWTCARCGNEFVNRNQFHSCRRHDPAELFAGKAVFVRDLFERFRAMVEGCGPVKTLAHRDKIGFMVRVRFAGAVPRNRWLEVGFRLPRRIESPRFHKIQTIHPNAHVHVMRVTRADELDAELAAWLREAYAVGRREPDGA